MLVLVTLAAGVAAATVIAAPGGSTGPSSSASPYLVRSQPGVVLQSILTVGDSVPKVGGGTYRMVGVPDGLGAFDNGDGTFTVLMNHELRTTQGIARAHGGKGAFVSKWVIRKDDRSVVSGEDLIKQLYIWNGSGYTLTTTEAIARLCSADLPAPSALWNAATQTGFNGRLFLDGEENAPPFGAYGRAFAHQLNGTSWELPALGKISWENALANAGSGDKTVVVGLDDDSDNGGQVYVYVGTKTNTGSAIERAGLTNGHLHGIAVSGVASEDATTGIASDTSFSLHDFGDVSGWSGETLTTESNAHDVTRFQRPEDGAWDPQDPHVFYFNTTASFSGKSRLWRLRFNDDFTAGKIDMLLAGTETGGTSERYHMLDNMTANGRGQLVLLEDPGNQPYVARVWLYDVASDTLTQIAEHDPARFKPPTPAGFNQDEESSGVVDVSSILGEGWYLLDVQAHAASADPELVERGQLLALHVPPGKFP